MLCLAQSIEVKYSVYSKQRKKQIEKILSNSENQGHKDLFAGMTAEKEDSFCLVIKDRQSSYVRMEPEEELSDDNGPKIVLVSGDYSEEDRAVYKDMTSKTMAEAKDLLADVVMAWFCPEIPVSEGPDVYAGLPGLILDLEDEKYVYRCMAIDTNSGSEIAKVKRGKKVSAKRFEELRKQMLDR